MNSAEPAAAANDQVGATQGPTGPTSTTAAAANTIISSSSSGSNTSGSNQSNSNSEADGKKRRNSNSTTTGENAAATTTTPADQDSPAKKRKQVKNACVNCQKACKKCEMARPCPRCVRYGLQDSCHDSVRKERKKGVSRGPYKRKSETQDGETPSPTPTPSPERMEGTSNTHNTRSSRAITEKAMGRHHHRIRSTTLLVLKREDIDVDMNVGTQDMSDDDHDDAEEAEDNSSGDDDDHADADPKQKSWDKLAILSDLCTAVLQHHEPDDPSSSLHPASTTPRPPPYHSVNAHSRDFDVTNEKPCRAGPEPSPYTQQHHHQNTSKSEQRLVYPSYTHHSITYHQQYSYPAYISSFQLPPSHDCHHAQQVPPPQQQQNSNHPRRDSGYSHSPPPYPYPISYTLSPFSHPQQQQYISLPPLREAFMGYLPDDHHRSNNNTAGHPYTQQHMTSPL